MQRSRVRVDGISRSLADPAPYGLTASLAHEGVLWHSFEAPRECDRLALEVPKAALSLLTITTLYADAAFLPGAAGYGVGATNERLAVYVSELNSRPAGRR